jgi:hypothetical protein
MTDRDPGRAAPADARRTLDQCTIAIERTAAALMEMASALTALGHALAESDAGGEQAEAQMVTIDQFVAQRGGMVTAWWVGERCRRGELACAKIGGTWFIAGDALERAATARVPPARQVDDGDDERHAADSPCVSPPRRRIPH